MITIGALLGMAAHLEGKGVSLLDVTGLAQKNGPVASHVRVARKPEDLHSTRIPEGGADLALGCDIVVTTGPDGMAKLSPRRTRPSSTRTWRRPRTSPRTPTSTCPPRAWSRAIAAAIGAERLDFVDATKLATALLGDAIGANLFLVGYRAPEAA